MPRCLVCGRFFHEGQGIVIPLRGSLLHFHSSRCAARFLRRLLEEHPEDCIVSAVKSLEEDYLKALKEAEERSKKRI